MPGSYRSRTPHGQRGKVCNWKWWAREYQSKLLFAFAGFGEGVVEVFEDTR